MTFQPGANLYTQGFGSRPEAVEVPHIDVRAPAAQDILYPIGKRWVNSLANVSYVLTSLSSSGGVTSATWAIEATTLGAIDTITADSGEAVPSSGNVNINGTANQIVTSASGSTLVEALSSTLVLPGTLTVAGTTNINATGAATTNIGTSTGTGNVNIGNATGTTTFPGATTFDGLLTTEASANIRTSSTVLNLGADAGGGAINLGNGASLRTIGIGNGSAGGTITIGAAVGTTNTTISAGSGGITLGAALNNVKALTGAAGIVGTATLSSGTVTVATTAVTASSKIFLTYNTPESIPGILSAPSASISAGVHFVINSVDGTDSTSTVNWFIIN